MANSEIVASLKSSVIKEIIKDDVFYYAIDSPKISSVDDRDKLTEYNVFSYNKKPGTTDDVTTFLTVQVHIPKTYDRNNTWVLPKLEIWIYSHVDHMKVQNIPKITANRNDYISILLDKKFNGKDDFGGNQNDQYNLHIFGKMDLVHNIEGAYSPDFMYRQLIFELKDLNKSMCGE